MVELEGPARDWSAVAEAWDVHADYVDEHSADSTRALIDRLDVRPGERVLELAAGPGSLGPTFSELVGPTGAVLLSDVAPGMVEVASRRNRDRENVRCEVLDASAIAEPDAAFDVVFSRMGLMFTPDPVVALREVRRVLAPGGRVGVMTWAAMEHNPWMACVGMAAMVAGLAAGGPPVGPGSIFSLGDPAEVERILHDAGFRDATVETADLVFEAPDLETHVRRVGSLAGPLAAALTAATPEQWSTVLRTAGEVAAPFAREGGYAIPGRVVLATARP